MRHRITAAAAGIQKLLHRNVDIADVLIAEITLAAEPENEREAVSPSGVFVDGEFHNEIPNRAAAAFLIDGGFEFLDSLGLGLAGGVVGELDDGVDVHLRDEIDVVEISGRDELDFHGSSHILEIRFRK